MARNIKLYLDDILLAIKKIEKYIKGKTFVKFQFDEKTIDAVIRNIEIIGEAANNIPLEIKKKNSGIPWKEMIGMRNKVIHEYFGVDKEVLWQTAKENLPNLKELVKKIK